MSSDNPIVSCDPHTIWPLPETERPAVITKLVQDCAGKFKEAVDQDDAGAAQDFAYYAVAAFAGLFPDPNDDAHVLLTSIANMFIEAKSGRHDHFLMRSTVPIRGMKRGTGNAYVGGFAISAVQVLTDRKLATLRSARKEVAEMLANAGYSLRRGEYDARILITEGAIRNWSENPEQYPDQNAIAADMAPIHAANLALRSSPAPAEVRAYLQDQAIKAVQHSRGI